MSDELREDYRFDYSKAKPNRFAARLSDRGRPDMAIAFVVQHTNPRVDDEDVKLTGVYSTRENADATVMRLSQQPGFADSAGGFSVDEYKVDQDQWTEGFVKAVPSSAEDKEFAELVEHLCRYPGMHVAPATLETVLAILDGYDQGHSNGLLAGFREWLVIQGDGWDNMYWTGLVRVRLRKRDDLKHDMEQNHEMIRSLGNLLAEFFQYRRSVGITKLHSDYEQWRSKQELKESQPI